MAETLPGAGKVDGDAGHTTDHNTLRTAVSNIDTRLATAESGKVATTRTINTTAPIAGGGALSADLTLTLNGPTVNAQTGTSYTLVIGDKNEIVSLSNASAVTLTVPPNASVAFATGTVITLINLGAGKVTIAPGAGVTISSDGGYLAFNQYLSATLVKTATNTWVAFGSLVP